MNPVDKALETQLKNIQTKTGKTLAELYALLGTCGPLKHGELRDFLKRDLALGHGDANTLVHMYLRSMTAGDEKAAAASPDDVLASIYAGGKAPLRPIHEALLSAIHGLGPFETAPKKAYVSLRRKKQFATIGPATKTRVEVGLNMKGVKPTDRLVELPAGGMCQYKVNLTTIEEVDSTLLGWIRTAYESAG